MVKLFDFVRKLGSDEALSGAESTVGAVFALAEAAAEHEGNIQNLKPLVGKVASLLDVLNSPLAQVAKEAVPFVGLGVGLVKFLAEVNHVELTRAQCGVLACQVAFLRSLKDVLDEEQFKVFDRPASEKVADVLTKLSDEDFSDDQVEDAVFRSFRRTKLAEQFGMALMVRLLDAEVTELEAKNIAERTVWGTPRYLIDALRQMVNAHEQIGPLLQDARDGWRKQQEKYSSIDEYLQEYVSPTPKNERLRDRWKVFAEPFTIQDIYVQPQVKAVDANGKLLESEPTVSLRDWVLTFLEGEKQHSANVMFVQGGPGRGKSAFCRMFAERVRRDFHPRWTPILIRLRDIETFENSLPLTLKNAVNAEFPSLTNDWLKNDDTRFLFLLDGFDELRLEGRTAQGIEEFLGQVGRLQTDCTESNSMGHKFLVTGRQLALQGLERRLPDNLARAEILAMEPQLQEEWLQKWGDLHDPEVAKAFGDFLNGQQCPVRVRELAGEPLLLYLLAAMHRDGRLKAEMFSGVSEISDKVVVYEESLEWVLTKQRTELLNRQLTEIETDGLRRILSEAGLCVVQSGGECAAMAGIELRLEGDEEASKLISAARARLGESPLRNALAAFYMQSSGGQEGSVEFVHKSFGEFLCAKRLVKGFEDWAALVTGRGKTSDEVPTDRMNWQLYDLLGFGLLSEEIVEYVMALVGASKELRDTETFERLFYRFNDFYLRWSDGEFIDALDLNLPQKKMKSLRELEVATPLGLKQVDVCVGLNAIKLLTRLHQYSQREEQPEVLRSRVSFYLCGDPETERFRNDRVLQAIGYSTFMGSFTFWENIAVHGYLRRADLSGAFLFGVDLHRTNLSGAFLFEANLFDASLFGALLRGADLRRAGLRRVDFSGANLRGADLSNADLSNADLRGANLRGANLFGALLDGADLIGADLRGADPTNIRYNKSTHWPKNFNPPPSR